MPEDFFNATELAKGYGKSADAWLHRLATLEYLEALAKGGCTTLMVSEGPHKDVLVHKDMAVEFMRWLSPEFAANVDLGHFSTALELAQNAGLFLDPKQLH